MVINAKKNRVYALAQGVTLPIALCLLHLESKFHGRIKYGILVPLLSNVVNLNVVLMMLKSHSIVLPTLFLGQLAELPRKKSAWE